MANKSVQLLREVFKHFSQSNFQRVASKATVVDGGVGRCVCEMTVEEEHENPGQTLHGGLTATLVDIVSTAALLTTERAHPGVSVDLNVTYLRAAKRGETIIIDASVLKTGKTLAFTSVDIRRKSDNELIAQGRHTKAFPPSS